MAPPPLPCRRSVPLALVVLVAWAGCGRDPGGASDERIANPPASIELTTESGVRAILVPGGSFRMGSGVDDEGPRREVTVSPFVMDKFEVMQEELARLQVPDASHFKSPDRPVEMVRWSEAALLCNERSRAEGLEPCYDELTFECDFSKDGYRLPTEAEWEYAARAGDDGDWKPGKVVPKLTVMACYAGNSEESTEPVGGRQANAWGFHDMLGNVAEWCHDRYAEDAYAKGGTVDPRGPEMGKKRVLRGGSWKSDEDELRVTARHADAPGIDDACFAQDSYGFRMVRKPTPAEAARLGSTGPGLEAADAASESPAGASPSGAISVESNAARD